MFTLIQTLNGAANETLKELSPWAYVIVVFAVAVAGVFLKFYISEKETNKQLEKEFRNYAMDSVRSQIDVSKDVISLVSRNKEQINEALKEHSISDTRMESLIVHIKDQLDRIEKLIPIRTN